VKIDIHDQLFKWRQVIVKAGHVSAGKKSGIGLMSKVLASPGLFRASGKIGRWMMKTFPGLLKGSYNPWSRQRELPAPPSESFREWYLKNKKRS
jgi:L-lactate dehydrogenase complex protein LldF